MKWIDNLCNGAKKAYYFVSTQAHAHRVEIYVAVGVGLGVAAVADAFYSAKKVAEKKNTEEGPTKKDYVKAAIRPALLEVGSVYAFLKGLNIVKDENAVLSAALAASLATQQKLIDRTSDTFGEESSEMIQLGKHSYVGDDANEKIDIANDYLLVINDDTIPEDHPLRRHMQSKMLLVDTIKMVQTSLELDLKLKGYVFYSEVYERLGLDPTPISRLVGWCLPDEKHPLPGDDKRDGFISFGLEELYEAVKSNNYDEKMEIIINPNLDGGIWDVYDKYNRNIILES